MRKARCRVEASASIDDVPLRSRACGGYSVLANNSAAEAQTEALRNTP